MIDDFQLPIAYCYLNRVEFAALRRLERLKSAIGNWKSKIGHAAA
jgi:hypothetical protein